MYPYSVHGKLLMRAARGCAVPTPDVGSKRETTWKMERSTADDSEEKNAGMPVPTAMWTRSFRSLQSESEQSIQRQDSVSLSFEMDEARWEVLMDVVEAERRARCKALAALPQAASNALATDAEQDEPDDSEKSMGDSEDGPLRAFRILTLGLRREFKEQLRSLEEDFRGRLDRLIACCESAAESAFSSHRLALDLKRKMESVPGLQEAHGSSPLQSADEPKEKMEDYPELQHWHWRQMQHSAHQPPSQDLEKQQLLKQPERPEGLYTDRARQILSTLGTIAIATSRPSDAEHISSEPSTVSVSAMSKSSNLLWGLSAQNKFDIDSSSLATEFDVLEGLSESAVASASLAKRARSLKTRKPQVTAPQTLSQSPPNASRTPARRASSAGGHQSAIEPRPQPEQRALSQVARSYTPRGNHACANSTAGASDSACQDTLLQDGLQKPTPVGHATIAPVAEVGQCRNQQPDTLPKPRSQQSHLPLQASHLQTSQQQAHALIPRSVPMLGHAQTPPVPGLPLQRLQHSHLQTVSQSVQALISPRVHLTGPPRGLVMHTAACRSLAPVIGGQMQPASCAQDTLRYCLQSSD
eukprot:TRINITY_DN23948_c0_g2_i1.p1 TRINITY_DN23948_c0_g2~~TRINITY_DN23948_c0_g2_i1.p1  ORF type:complete len:585 (-),score=91.88 TRINITY_DN23948_c0_g2_i1:45-1799(-)